MDKRTNYDFLIQKIILLRKKFAGTYIPSIISSYLFRDFRSMIELRRFKSMCGDPMYFPVSFMNSLVNNSKYVNDTRGRYIFNSATLYQYFETVWEDEDDQSLELRTKMKSVYIGPVRFCVKTGEYTKWCKCKECYEKPENYVIAFSDSDEEADIVF